MGRWYYTQNFEGKFGFAVQPSNDAEIYGMEIDEEAMEEIERACEEDGYPVTSVEYFLQGDEESIRYAEMVLDAQYDIFNVPKEKRLYSIKDLDELCDFKDEYIDPVCFREFDREKDKGITPYGGFPDEWLVKWGYKSDTLVPVSPEMPLARCRIDLGLYILSDLKKDGYCTLSAEI